MSYPQAHAEPRALEPVRGSRPLIQDLSHPSGFMARLRQVDDEIVARAEADDVEEPLTLTKKLVTMLRDQDMASGMNLSGLANEIEAGRMPDVGDRRLRVHLQITARAAYAHMQDPTLMETQPCWEHFCKGRHTAEAFHDTIRSGAANLMSQAGISIPPPRT